MLRAEQIWRISIHALREEGDLLPGGQIVLFPLFLSTPSARRATFGRTTSIETLEKFLSTPSARRATIWVLSRLVSREISIHALREEGDRVLIIHGVRDGISIHALREEGDGRRRRMA